MNNLRNNFYYKKAINWIKENKRTFYKTLLIFLILLSAFVVKAQNDKNSNIKLEEDVKKQAAEFVVDISGAVNKPGVYKLSEDKRICDLIELAGGLTEDADLDLINQAEFVEDGKKIIVPSKTEDDMGDENAGGDTKSGESNGKININNASLDQLKQLDGIGDVIANRIIDYRKGSRFKKIEDIKNVKGIGDSIYSKIEAKIIV